MEFRQRLRELRERRGLSQNKLAQAAGVAQAVVQRLEAGVREVDHLSVGVARRLAKALGVSIDHLVGMYEDERKPASAVLVRA
jgi:transcriptional regulator with XRE-family HTH domain